jgi:uncharacterized membrane protein (UPF0127 family)
MTTLKASTLPMLSYRLPAVQLAASVLLLSLSSAVWAQQTPVEMPVTTLNIGINVIKAEVASNDPDRERGLMFRPALGSNQGMVFVFDAGGQECMWMKNTLIPLSVAFMDEHGKITNIEDMQPQTENNHCSKAVARYALEMNFGWFAAHGVRPGMSISNLPGAR